VNAEGHESRNILPHLSKFGIESSIVHSLKAFRGSEEGNLKVGSMIGVPTAFDTLCPGEVTPNENTIKLNLPLGKISAISLALQRSAINRSTGFSRAKMSGNRRRILHYPAGKNDQNIVL
jgi:hypothetical protein